MKKIASAASAMVVAGYANLASAEQVAAAKLSEAALFPYKKLCDLPEPQEPSGGFRAVAGTSTRITGCGDLEKEWGKPAAVRLHFTASKAGKSEAVLKGLKSISISGGSTGKALGLQLRHPSPLGGGFSADIVNRFEGEMAFAVPEGGAIDLVVLFKGAAIGDFVTVGEGKPVRISK